MTNGPALEPEDYLCATIIRTADPSAIAEAATRLGAGELVAFPTETVYGLGADANNGEAVARIFAAKGRPRFNPLIVHVESFQTATTLGQFNTEARQLAKAFWPGPLTIVVKRQPDTQISDLVSAGLDTIALRVPAHKVALKLLVASKLAIAAPSANRSGHVSATDATHVASDLKGRVPLILDDGHTTHGLESTVIDASSDELVVLRPGAVPIDAIAAVLGRPIRRGAPVAAAPLSPGQLESHYAPRARLRLGATAVDSGEALLAFGPDVPPTVGPVINLSRRGDLIEAAAGLFAALRTLDASGASIIAVMPIPSGGIGEAINDRLERAAAPR